AIPAGDGAIRTGAVNRVRRAFHDGGHLAGGAIGARFRQGFLAGHAAGEHRNGEERRQLLQVSRRADAETEVGWNSEEIQASGGDQRTENGGAKTEKTSGQEHRRQQKRKEVALQHGRKSPEAERDPHGKRGSSVLHQRGITIPCDPTLQIGFHSRHFLECCRLPLTTCGCQTKAGKTAFNVLRNSSSTGEARQPASLREGRFRYWGASNLRRLEPGPCSANVTVKGARKVKFSTVSEGSRICWPLPAACTPPPMPPPAAAPMPAPFPPPMMPPRMAPTTAPPPTFSAVFVERFLPWRRYGSASMKKDLPLTEIVSSCKTSSDCPANFPALFTSWTCPFTSYPEGTASPSEGRGASSVARKVCPGWAFSESRGSSSRIAIDVPDGTVTLFGAG